MAYIRSLITVFSGLLALGVSFSQEVRDSRVCVFEQDNISSSQIEYGSVLSPDGKEIYFSRSKGQWGHGPVASTIYVSSKRKGKWLTNKTLCK